MIELFFALSICKCWVKSDLAILVFLLRPLDIVGFNLRCLQTVDRLSKLAYAIQSLQQAIAVARVSFILETAEFRLIVSLIDILEMVA